MKFADKPSRMLQRATLWAAPLLLAITVFVVPVTNSWIKTFQLGLFVVTLASWLVRLRKWRVALFGAAAVLLAVAVLFCLPARRGFARNELPSAYVDALQRYQGVIYWWGGESSRGIDCSGLIRRGMMDAALQQGLTNADGEILRAAADLWWHDCSADALGQGYRGYTVPITEAASLNALDHSKVLVGDLAIAGGGSHILAYLGDKRWIQADPTAQSVIAETAPAKNGWFKGRVKIVRWKWLEPATTKSGQTTQ